MYTGNTYQVTVPVVLDCYSTYRVALLDPGVPHRRDRRAEVLDPAVLPSSRRKCMPDFRQTPQKVSIFYYRLQGTFIVIKCTLHGFTVIN